jgi:hypothetical protein
MSKKLVALCVLLLAGAPLSGCWVMDEIDRGSKWMDDHSARPKDAAAAAGTAKADAKQRGALGDYIQQQDASGATKTFTPGEVSEGIVACKLGGVTQFMKKEHCAARGGRS